MVKLDQEFDHNDEEDDPDDGPDELRFFVGPVNEGFGSGGFGAGLGTPQPRDLVVKTRLVLNHFSEQFRPLGLPVLEGLNR